MLRSLTLLAFSAGLLLLLAGHFAKAAFVAGSLRQGRVLSVDRAVSHGGYAHAKFRKEVMQMNDEELHDIIAESRKMMLHFRLEKFRKKRPSAGSKYEWQYKIALAKTFLKERELAAMSNDEAFEPEPLSKDYPSRPTLAEEMKQTEDLEMAKAEWYDIGGWGSKPMGSKSDYPRNVGFEKQFYRKYGTVYDQPNKTYVGGWSWDPSKSDRSTNIPPGDWRPGGQYDKNVKWQATFQPDSIDIKRARKKAKREAATSTEAIASKVLAPSTSGLFVGAALLGLAASRGFSGRRF
mmetsp:Transcript_30616/g.49234  ORF Transcript_30616/g.49234 Transcript_30616/m.49234 type:complete len:293 (+) Transcript_30616:81-959(+)